MSWGRMNRTFLTAGNLAMSFLAKINKDAQCISFQTGHLEKIVHDGLDQTSKLLSQATKLKYLYAIYYLPKWQFTIRESSNNLTREAFANVIQLPKLSL